MNTQPEPNKDPNLGVWTREWARWAIDNKSDDEFQFAFKMSKESARRDFPDTFPELEDAPTTAPLQVVNPGPSDEQTTEKPEKPAEENTDAKPTVDKQVDELPQTQAPDEVETPPEETQPDVDTLPTTEGVDESGGVTDQALADLAEMHHKTFSKQYGLTKKEYKAKHNIE